jgi:hypothetical protein
MSATTTPTKDQMLDRVSVFIASNGGSANVRQILANCYGNTSPDSNAINAAHRRLFADARFVMTGDGAEAVVSLAGEPETLTAEPEPATETGAITDGAPVVPQDDATAEPVAEPAPDIDAKPISQTIIDIAVGQILTIAAAEGGYVSIPDLTKRILAMSAAEIDAAINYLARDGQIDGECIHIAVILEPTGWQAAMALAKKMSDLVLAKKDDEINAYRKRVAREKELADEIQACEADVEACKARVSVAKDDLATANEKLAAFVRGDVQTTFLGEKSATAPTGEVTAYEQGMRHFNPKKAEAVNPYPADPQASDWQRGYDAAKAQHTEKNPAPAVETEATATGEAIFPDAPKAPVRQASELGLTVDQLDRAFLDDLILDEIRRGSVVSVGDKTIYAFEREYVVIDGTQVEPLHYLALPLYRQAGSTNEWADLGHEAKYGRCVEGVDQTEEAKGQRQTGGEFCGKVVKVGRKKCVVGPMSDALVIAVQEVTPAASDEPGDEGIPEDGRDTESFTGESDESTGETSEE